MLIDRPCVVTLTWTLHDAQGEAIDALNDPMEFYFGGDDLLAKVEDALQGQEAGFETLLHLDPEHAFGDYDASKVCFENRELFPEELEQGMQIEGLPEGARTEGMPDDTVYTVTEIFPTHVVLDGNHPLAGIGLRLQLKVHDVREASAFEIEQCSVAGGLFSVGDSDPGSGTLH